MKEHKQKPSASDQRKAVRVNRIVPGEMRSVFADHFLVQHSPAGDFHLYFFELNHPIRLGELDEEEVSEVDAHCVAKVVITKQVMGSIIGAMAENFAKSTARERPAEARDESQSSGEGE